MDDFNYTKYIEEEMKNINTRNMNENVKKKLIQKIRNRMSAQRSRVRQKNKMTAL